MSQVQAEKQKCLPYTKEAVFEYARNFAMRAIAQLIPHREFQPTVAWVSTKLTWLSYDEIAESLDLLKKYGFLVTEDGKTFKEVYIDINDYLSESEIDELQFIFSSEVANKISESKVANNYQTTVLSSKELFIEWALAVNKLTKEFQSKSESLPSTSRNGLFMISINGIDAIQTKKVGH